MKLGMVIELDKCVGCMACVSACKQRWNSGPGAARDWVREVEFGTRGKDLGLTFYPGLCMHCEDHPCTRDCPTGATYRNQDGVVVVDPKVCIGCGNCIPACPYGARHPDPDKNIVEKCNLCAPYLAQGASPACVQTCLAQCRHFGDLDDPNSPASRKRAERDAKPLVTASINPRPKVLYAPEALRNRVIAADAVKPPSTSALTQVWQGYTRPLARFGVPLFAVIAAAGGALINFRSRAKSEHPKAASPSLERHSAGMRALHWFNATSWIVLLVTGTALMAAPSFALFGSAMPSVVSRIVGGAGNLLRLHAVWGVIWALVIVPLFLLMKRGGLDALREIWITRDDIRWLMAKPMVALGLRKASLPPQDKYNAGQKVFAASALVGTSFIILSGVVMTFHIGSPMVVSNAILVHKLAIALALMGLAVHITMAAIVREERPALRSMITGRIDKTHAELHSPRWVAEHEQPQQQGSSNTK